MILLLRYRFKPWAGSSNFPTSVDNYTALTDGVDIIQADDVNNAYVPINYIETFIGASGAVMSKNTDILAQLANSESPIVAKASASTLSVSAGTIVVKNSSQSVRVMRRSTAAKTVTASNLDTGTMAANTYYYVYACADAAGSDFTVVFSTSASAPTGYTNYELIGWFYNETISVLDVTSGYVGNNKARRNVPNVVAINGSSDQSTSSTSFGDLMTIRFYSSGRPLLYIFDGVTAGSSNNIGARAVFDVDGSNVANSIGREISSAVAAGDPASYRANISIFWVDTLAAGTHTIKVQYCTGPAGTTHIYERRFTVIEL